MRAFIYDKYGYYPSEEFATSFIYQGWFFKLEISEKNDIEIHSLRLLLDEINHQFEPLGSDVILTRDNHYVSQSEYGPVVLVAVKIGEVNTDVLYKMHQIFFNRFNDKKLLISHLRNLWIHKMDMIEERIIPSLPLDDKEFKYLRILSEYALGLAENAVQYLLDAAIYYGDEINQITLAHKRLDRFDSFHLFNPFNLVVDSPMRDLAELYKCDNITLENLYLLLKKYHITSQDASILMARCIFPSRIFDLLEDYYELKKDIRIEINEYYKNLDNRLFKLKKLHRFLVKNYQIRPINWLDK